jgi:hypothetical protein
MDVGRAARGARRWCDVAEEGGDRVSPARTAGVNRGRDATTAAAAAAAAAASKDVLKVGF